MTIMCAANQKDSGNREEIRDGRASFIQPTPIQQTPFVRLGREVCAELGAAESREWLVTNGLGSFASGTVAGILTRRYHGLLIAALDPPQKRTLLVTKVDEIASVGGAEFMLGANRWRGGVVDPQGYTMLESFWLEGSVPVWSYALGGAILEKRVWMQHGANTTFVEYRLVKTTGPAKTTGPVKTTEPVKTSALASGADAVNLAVKVMVNYRDLHGETRGGNWRMNIEPSETPGGKGLRVTAFDGATPFFLLSTSEGVSVEAANDWYYNYDLALERERGLGDSEDHLHAATFHASIAEGQSILLAFTTDAALNLNSASKLNSPSKLSSTTSIAAEEARTVDLLARMQGAPAPKLSFVGGTVRAGISESLDNALASLAATRESSPLAVARKKLKSTSAALTPAKVLPTPANFSAAPAWIQQLVLAADQFLVEARREPSPDVKSTQPNVSIIAGYPWFGVWSRDSAISLCGLALVTGRAEFARNLLRNAATFIDGGMLPNYFPEHGEKPEFNSVDAALWFVDAVRQYLESTRDLDFAREVFPVLAEIARNYSRGTRFGIHADPADGLLFAGEADTNLTWMDAQAGGKSITPRIGKPVEINALWINALESLAAIARQVGQPSLEFQGMAKRARDNFERFWNPERRCCFDVLDGPAGNDASLRPNQIFAVSLPVSALTVVQQRAVVESCAQNLVTPFGLRSLAPTEPNYSREFLGNEEARAAAYHQGTVWAWLLGPFALAHFRVYRDGGAALKLFGAIPEHMNAAGLGTISEVFDAEAPFAPRGCPAQAWSVAEILRAWITINASGAK
jgi:glycogen debranching enzyme